MHAQQQYESEAARWEALVARDSHAAAAFVYGVRTTGIYCRPGCASRQPRREHVAFFASAAAAEHAGFRPCKRCQPQAQSEPTPAAELVARACAMIEAAESPPTLSELAAGVGLSPHYFQRLFRQTLGVTPRQYAAARRAERLREQLGREASITEAIYAAGFGSSGGFYAQSAAQLGMTPGDYRAGGRGRQIRYASAPCALGWVGVAATEQGLCAIELADTAAELPALLAARFPQALLTPAGDDFASSLSAVVNFLEAPGRELGLPLDLQGTVFQRQVWAALQQLPAGSTASYSAIAERIGRPGAARAVAGACAANPLAVVVPCHRVVRGSGDLGGYRWGLARKRALLAREAELSERG